MSDSGIVDGVECISQMTEDAAFLYLKCFVLLYAYYHISRNL